VTTPLTGDHIKDVIAQISAANAASAPWNPYSPIIEGVLALIAIGTSVFGVKKKAEASKSATVLNEVVSGIEEAKKALVAIPTAVDVLKAALSGEQTVNTEIAVNAVRDTL
jgi:hypothetical protein